MRLSTGFAIWGFLWDIMLVPTAGQTASIKKKGLTGPKQRIKGNVLEWGGITVAGILSRFCRFMHVSMQVYQGASVAYTFLVIRPSHYLFSYLSISIDFLTSSRSGQTPH